MCGSETLTIELSSTSSTVPSITENAITHLRVEENSWTSCVVCGIDLGATAIRGILAYGTKGRARMQKTRSRNTVTDNCLAHVARGRFIGRAELLCHPDEASRASGWSWLLASGQRGASAAGSGSEFCIRLRMDRCAISKTGTGFADAKLSEILPSARVARSVRMTQKIPALAFARMTEKDACACRANDESGGTVSPPANRHTGRRTVSASGRRATRVLRLRRYRRARSAVRGCARLRRETLAAARLRA